MGQIINFMELRLQKSVLLSVSADFLLGQVCRRPVTRSLSVLEIFLRGDLVLILLK